MDITFLWMRENRVAIFLLKPQILNIINMRNVPVKSSGVLICLYLLLISRRLHTHALMYRNLLPIYFKFNSIAVFQKKYSQTPPNLANIISTSSKHIYSNGRLWARHSGGLKAETCCSCFNYRTY